VAVAPIDWAAVGAFLSGAGSVLSAVWYARRARRQASEDCDKRLQAFKEGLHEMEPKE
jgi:hypothetical protein